MSEQTIDPRERALEERSRALFHESVEALDMATRSRLTQARHRALEAARRAAGSRRLGLHAFLAPAAGVTAVTLLATVLWFGTPLGHHPAAEPQAAFEDLDLIASSDEGSGDALEMMQEDPDFYAWATRSANPEPAV